MAWCQQLSVTQIKENKKENADRRRKTEGTTPLPASLRLTQLCRISVCKFSPFPPLSQWPHWFSRHYNHCDLAVGRICAHAAPGMLSPNASFALFSRQHETVESEGAKRATQQSNTPLPDSKHLSKRNALSLISVWTVIIFPCGKKSVREKENKRQYCIVILRCEIRFSAFDSFSSEEQ